MTAGVGFPNNGQAFTIIDNQGAGAVGGVFKRLPEGSSLVTSTGVFQISYVGGTGHDTLSGDDVTTRYMAAQARA